MMDRQGIKRLVLAALFLALGLVLPSAFHMVGAGPVFLPMHIPVLLCGFVCGWQYGLAVGLLTPLLSSFTGMPPLFPTAIAMMFELGAYGCLTGLLRRKLGCNVYVSLIAAMLGGRVVSGLANAALMGVAGKAYGLTAFLSASFVTAVPGIVIQVVLIPLVVLALERTGLVARRRAH